MRTRAWPLLAVLVLGMLLGGCTSPSGDGPGDGNDPSGTAGPDDNDVEGPGRIAPPKEQRVDSRDDIDRAGEYAFLPRATPHTNARWDVPTWNTGDTWRYRVSVPAAPTMCAEYEEKVTDSGTEWEVTVYHIERTERKMEREATSCVDKGPDHTRQTIHTADGLLEIEENGYIERVFVFPAQDGLRWVFARDDPEGNLMFVEAEARHDPAYAWDGRAVSAWHVTLDYGGPENVRQEYWFGVDQKNVLRREIWADANGVPTLWFASTLVSYTPAPS